MRRTLAAAATALLLVLGSAAPHPAQDGDLDANGTDYIDLFYPGWTDPHLTIGIHGGAAVTEETLAAFAEAVAI
jgi:hypothetical protein